MAKNVPNKPDDVKAPPENEVPAKESNAPATPPTEIAGDTPPRKLHPPKRAGKPEKPETQRLLTSWKGSVLTRCRMAPLWKNGNRNLKRNCAKNTVFPKQINLLNLGLPPLMNDPGQSIPRDKPHRANLARCGRVCGSSPTSNFL